MKPKLLTVYCFSHFLVDFCCAFFMFSLFRFGNDWLAAVLIYNFCAFALQMPLGLLADKINRNSLFAAAGCIAAAVSVIIPHPITCAAVMGLGNALFHVGGGIDSLNMSEEKCLPLGLFVSPGAVGLCLGTMLAGSFSVYILAFALCLCAGLILFAGKHSFSSWKSENAPLTLPRLPASAIICAICFFAVVCLRSFAGMSFSFSWKDTIPAVVTVLFVASGKAFGGIAADLLGSKLTSVISLSLCAVLFLFSSNALCGLLALLLFNMTMPITLWELAKLFPKAKGFSFGMLTFALFIGFLPVYFGTPALSAIPAAISAVSSLALLLIGLRRQKNVA